VGRLLVTGVPGWLSDSLLLDLARNPLPGLTAVRCLVDRKNPVDTRELRHRYGIDVEVIRGDLVDPASLEPAVEDVDTVVHGAAIMHVHRIGEYYEINTEGTRKLARAAARQGAGRFVYVSTNAAAGRSESPQHLVEESDPDRPLSQYGRSKWLGERWLLAAGGAMEPVVLRSCMFYGPPVPARHVAVYRRIVSGRIPLVGGGRYTRSLTYIDNLVAGVRLATYKAAAAGQTYNIADAEPYTTKRVVDAMASALGVAPKYWRLPAFAASVAYEFDWLLSTAGLYQQEVHLVGEATWNVGVSIEKARRELGYAPRVAIDEGMREAIHWCRARGLL
jgi:nucleoside-diphosphate-sugar epimerase